MIISTLLRDAVRLAGGLLGVATARTDTAFGRLEAPRAAKRGWSAVPVAKADCMLSVSDERELTQSRRFTVACRA